MILIDSLHKVPSVYKNSDRMQTASTRRKIRKCFKKRPFDASDKGNRPGSNGEAEKSNHIVCVLLGIRNSVYD